MLGQIPRKSYIAVPHELASILERQLHTHNAFAAEEWFA